MATEVLKTFSALQDELQKAKDGLRNVDDHIKRIIGRDPDSHPQGPGPGPGPGPAGGTPRPGQKRNASHLEEYHGRGRGFSFPGRGRGGGPGRGGPGRQQQDDDGPPGIRRRLGDKTVFSRLSGPPSSRFPRREQVEEEEEEEEMEDDDMQYKPAISSRVIPQVREQPSKEEIIAAQGDERSKARNRRMFGALLGTLQRFRQEETRLRDKEDKRAQVEKKLEEAAKREKEEMKKERSELFSDRRRKQEEIRKIEYKMNRVKEQDHWEARHRPLLNFIQTKTKPPIFYLPKIHNTKTEERLVASQKVIAKIMEKKRAALQEELDNLDGNVQVKNEEVEGHHFPTENDGADGNGENEEEDMDDDSPPENKENRLRSVNVKVEKDVEPKVTLAGKIVRPDPEEKKTDSDRRSDHPRESGGRDRRDQRDHRDQREQRERQSSRERPRDNRPHVRERDASRDRGRQRERERERGRDRERERRSDRDIKKEIKKEEEDKWDRKRDRGDSSEMNKNEEIETLHIDAPELSSIALPGSSSPLVDQNHHDL